MNGLFVAHHVAMESKTEQDYVIAQPIHVKETILNYLYASAINPVKVCE